jgi:hypothetical protein
MGVLFSSHSVLPWAGERIFSKDKEQSDRLKETQEPVQPNKSVQNGAKQKNEAA